MRGNPRCFGKLKKYYSDVLVLERTDKGILIKTVTNGSPCVECKKRGACFAIAIKDEIQSIFQK